MKSSPIEENLLRAIEKLEVIDAHEHLPPEKVRLEQNVDVFTLFSHYTRVDLLASGMPLKFWARIHDPAIPFAKRWERFAPYLRNIRYGAYARPAFIAAREFYGFDDINRINAESLSERIAAGNTPGIYHRILREKCKIRVALTQSNRTDYNLDLLVPLMRLKTYVNVKSKKSIEENAEKLGEKVKALDDYLELIRKGFKKWKSEGVVGVKMNSKPYSSPNKGKAAAIFDRLMREQKNLPSQPRGVKYLSPVNDLESYLIDETLNMAAELELVVAVHTGMWGDFRASDPQHMIPILSNHPKTKFDIYHMGIPYVRETAIIGKNFPNVWLNLCWCHIISPKIACQAIDELIDLVPINKVIAFGGDYREPVEHVYGHLVMARENITKVLSRRIQDKLLTVNEAIEISKKWFYDNPKELYQLKVS